MTYRELLDKQIGDLNALLEMVNEDWEWIGREGDIIWFAQLVNKTRALRDALVRERKNG